MKHLVVSLVIATMLVGFTGCGKTQVKPIVEKSMVKQEVDASTMAIVTEPKQTVEAPEEIVKVSIILPTDYKMYTLGNISFGAPASWIFKI